jgi:hypothetical protein
MSESAGIALLVFGPAVVGVVCLGLAIALFVGGNGETVTRGSRIALHVFAAIFLVASLGIGACYGVMVMS